MRADIFDWSGLRYLILINSYSGWFEMITLIDLSSTSGITKMKQQFAVDCIPSKLLRDSGLQFANREFKSFDTEWSFERVTSIHYFPRSNGFAENAVKQAKNLLEKCKEDVSDPFLGPLKLRNVPRDQVLASPAQQLMWRHSRSISGTSLLV